MDNNYNNNKNTQGYTPYGEVHNSGYENNNYHTNQHYNTQNNQNYGQQNNNMFNKSNYQGQYGNSSYNNESYNQQYNNAYNKNSNDSVYGQYQYDKNAYNQGNYDPQYDNGGYNGQQYNPQMDYKYNNGLPSNPPGYGHAIGSMVCGICALVSCWCYGFPGIVLGIIALVLYYNSKKRDGGVASAMAKAGMVCGLISIILGVIYAAYVVFAFIVLGLTISDPSFYSDFYSTAFLR